MHNQVPQSTRPRLIFVVDDERTIASSFAAILRMHGFSARYFLDPLEALDAARADPPDLLLSDVAMPQLSGVDLAIRMQQECPTCKILLFSGQADTEDLLRAAREQGHDFRLLAKPIHPRDLLLEIGKVADSANPGPQPQSP
jgi:FixJ family two-component response regulator